MCQAQQKKEKKAQNVPLQHLYWSPEVIHQDKQDIQEEPIHDMMSH
jgi:hypothetical protein